MKIFGESDIGIDVVFSLELPMGELSAPKIRSF
jgi:hypothetical protein